MPTPARSASLAVLPLLACAALLVLAGCVGGGTRTSGAADEEPAVFREIEAEGQGTFID